MPRFVRLVRLLLTTTIVLLVAASPAAAVKQTVKKSIWGPLTLANGKSAFPTYRDLGVGIYQVATRWNDIAPQKPANPRDPSDPAYHWPANIDQALAEASRTGIRVLVMIQGSPPWANGGKDSRWAPDPKDFADFMYAASRRWPGVRYWMVWGEPCKGINFQPLVREEPGHVGEPLNKAQRIGPETYAGILDAAYGALKEADRKDLVIGGNCFTGPANRATTGDMSPLNWMRYMRLPNGKRPRMDLYGHNPVSARRPDLRRKLIEKGSADFSDLDTFARWLDKYQRKGMRIFLSEFFLQTDHFGAEAPYYVTRRTAADWTRAALRITRHDKRLYSFGWLTLEDFPPNPSGDELTYGLLDYQDRKKPAYNAFKFG